MPDGLQIYKCNQCGNIVEVKGHLGDAQLVCCATPMEFLKSGLVEKPGGEEAKSI
jgi:desulfoferrodoxin-like iron-binding protein